jgi:excisionase family DNA binding protein
MTEKRWYSIKEVADRLDVSHDTVNRVIARGDLAAIRVSDRIVRIPAPALHRFESGAKVERRAVVRRRVSRGVEMGAHEDIPQRQATTR